MRTDIRLLRLDQFGFPPAPAATQLPAGLLTEGVDLAGHTIALDSHPHTEWLECDSGAEGVIFGSLDHLVKQHGDLIRQHLYSQVRPRSR